MSGERGGNERDPLPPQFQGLLHSSPIVDCVRENFKVHEMQVGTLGCWWWTMAITHSRSLWHLPCVGELTREGYVVE